MPRDTDVKNDTYCNTLADDNGQQSCWGYMLYTSWPSADYNPDPVTVQSKPSDNSTAILLFRSPEVVTLNSYQRQAILGEISPLFLPCSPRKCWHNNLNPPTRSAINDVNSPKSTFFTVINSQWLLQKHIIIQEISTFVSMEQQGDSLQNRILNRCKDYPKNWKFVCEVFERKGQLRSAPHFFGCVLSGVLCCTSFTTRFPRWHFTYPHTV